MYCACMPPSDNNPKSWCAAAVVLTEPLALSVVIWKMKNEKKRTAFSIKQHIDRLVINVC